MSKNKNFPDDGRIGNDKNNAYTPELKRKAIEEYLSGEWHAPFGCLSCF